MTTTFEYFDLDQRQICNSGLLQTLPKAAGGGGVVYQATKLDCILTKLVSSR